MPDISKCNNDTCPLRKDCYRFIVKPSEYQYYTDFKPDESGKCDAYWPVDTQAHSSYPESFE